MEDIIHKKENQNYQDLVGRPPNQQYESSSAGANNEATLSNAPGPPPFAIRQMSRQGSEGLISIQSARSKNAKSDKRKKTTSNNNAKGQKVRSRSHSPTPGAFAISGNNHQRSSMKTHVNRKASADMMVRKSHITKTSKEAFAMPAPILHQTQSLSVSTVHYTHRFPNMKTKDLRNSQTDEERLAAPPPPTTLRQAQSLTVAPGAYHTTYQFPKQLTTKSKSYFKGDSMSKSMPPGFGENSMIQPGAMQTLEELQKPSFRSSRRSSFGTSSSRRIHDLHVLSEAERAGWINRGIHLLGREASHLTGHLPHMTWFAMVCLFLIAIGITIALALLGRANLLGPAQQSADPTTTTATTVTANVTTIKNWKDALNVCETVGVIDASLFTENTTIIRIERLIEQLNVSLPKLEQEEEEEEEEESDDLGETFGCTAKELAILSMALLPSSADISLQRYILSLVFFETRGKFWGTNDLWMSEVGICMGWNGVDCLGSSEIIGLDLKGLSLNGTIPEELFMLSRLRQLSLGGNIHGTIPSNISLLQDLEDLELEGPDLSGTIPPSLANLTFLRALTLQSTKLSGTIPSELGTEDMRVLKLISNSFSGTFPKEIASKAPNLIELELGGPLKGTFPDEYWNLPLLDTLNLTGTRFFGTINWTKWNWKSIEISKSNNFEGSISSEIGELQDLRWLGITNNFIGGTIATELGLCTSLERLDISGNELSGPIPSELGSLSLIRRLSLASNFLTGTIPYQLSNLTSLEILFLYATTSCTGVDNVFAQTKCGGLKGTIPKDICNIESLQEFVVSCNTEVHMSCPQDCCRCF